MEYDKIFNMEQGIKLCTQVPPDVTDEFLTFLEQIGVKYVYAWFSEEQFNFKYLSEFKKRVNSHGIEVYNVGAVHMAKCLDIILGLEGRDAAIEMFNNNLKMLSEVGIHTTTFTWEPEGVWASDWDYPTRGGALTRKCDLHVLERNGIVLGKKYTQIPIDQKAFAETNLTHGRIYSREEMWKNYSYFIKKVIPSAEKYGIRLALHPNDPPVDSVAGVGCLIRSFDDYKRAFAIADSDFLGMEFCCGCWLETGNRFGDLFEAIKYFEEQKKIYLVHFRNVDAQLPCFVETFIDEGYGDMLEIMKAFYRAGYRGTVVLDHSPRMVEAAGAYGETAYANGYIKALMKCAEKLCSEERKQYDN